MLFKVKPQTFVIGSAVGVALVFGLLVYLGSSLGSVSFESDSSSTENLGNILDETSLSAVPYAQGMATLLPELQAALGRTLSAADAPVLAALRDKLATLVVAPEQRSGHFQLVVKLTQLAELLSTGKTSGKTKGTTVSSLQAELEQLVASSAVVR